MKQKFPLDQKKPKEIPVVIKVVGDKCDCTCGFLNINYCSLFKERLEDHWCHYGKDGHKRTSSCIIYHHGDDHDRPYC